ncbi:MAG: 50S ribosomal protein L19 [Candidatus Magasanikbacteria bacterium]|nr:50S ribosomal protein L19 [Candidatus Magasanikbacteria bacterium]
MSEDIRLDLKPGMIVKVHQKIKELNAKGEEKERIQIFEGMVIAQKHGGEQGATVTVRKVSEGVGVEKIYPIHSPVVDKIELVRQMKVRQARPYYLRTHKKRLKEVKPVAEKKAE